MSGKQIAIALAGLSVVVLLFLTIFNEPDPEVKVAAAPGSGNFGTDEESIAEKRQPGSLALGGSRASSGDGESSNPRDGVRDRAALDRYRQAHRPRLGGNSPDHGAAGGDDSGGTGGPQVRSQLDDTTSLANAGGKAAGRGGIPPRVGVDDWPEDVPVTDPAAIREPEEGEVLSLFEGDAALSQAEAVIDKDVTFDENGANFSLDSEYAVPMAGRMSGEAGTISFWVRPDGEISDIDNASLVQLRSQNEWSNRLQIWKDGTNVRLVFADGNGIESGATYGSDSWAPDEWRLVTATWGEGMTALYVNGLLAGTSQFDGGFKILPNTLLHVGSNYKEDPRSLNGAVNQFRVYDRPLSPDEVSNLASQYPE